MSDEGNPGEGQEKPKEGEGAKASPKTVKVEDFEKLQSEMGDLKSTNARLLDESKEATSKYRTLRDSVDQKDKEALEKKEDFKTLLDQEKEHHFQTKETNKELKRTMLSKSLHLEVAKYATDAHDVQDIINSLPREGLTVDDKTMNFTGVKDGIQKLRDEKAWLFKSNSLPDTTNSRPKTVVPGDGDLSYDDWVKLPYKEKKANLARVKSSAS